MVRFYKRESKFLANFLKTSSNIPLQNRKNRTIMELFFRSLEKNFYLGRFSICFAIKFSHFAFTIEPMQSKECVL